MTTLQIRRVQFNFEDDVDFCWQPEHPEFALEMNMIGLMIIGFEKYIVDATRSAMPFITDPAALEEADAFLRQEAQHARVHRMHAKALFRKYPGLKDVVDGVVADYDARFARLPLKYHLAYIADLEATFTPFFKQILDHADELFGPGDERVSSMLLWHFTEEIEHRSSALVVFNAVVGKPWYRLRHLPSILNHVGKISRLVCNGINEHVPLEDRKVDARNVLPLRSARRQIGARFPFALRGFDLRYPGANETFPAAEQVAMQKGLLASQKPSHDPTHQPLPEFAAEWVARYDAGDDVANWFSSKAKGRN